jgi:hypothetical protein
LLKLACRGGLGVPVFSLLSSCVVCLIGFVACSYWVFALFSFSGLGVGCLSCWLMVLVVSSINGDFVVSVFWVFG